MIIKIDLGKLVELSEKCQKENRQLQLADFANETKEEDLTEELELVLSNSSGIKNVGLYLKIILTSSALPDGALLDYSNQHLTDQDAEALSGAFSPSVPFPKNLTLDLRTEWGTLKSSLFSVNGIQTILNALANHYPEGLRFFLMGHELTDQQSVAISHMSYGPPTKRELEFLKKLCEKNKTINQSENSSTFFKATTSKTLDERMEEKTHTYSWCTIV